MVRKTLVLVDPHLTYSATTVTADWELPPKRGSDDHQQLYSQDGLRRSLGVGGKHCKGG